MSLLVSTFYITYTYTLNFNLKISTYVMTEMWLVNTNESGSISQVRNLFWEGYGFYSSLEDSDNGFGGAYFGNGLPNQNIVYML